MGKNPRVNGHNLSRLTVSGGKRIEPRLMMAHPIGETKPTSHRLRNSVIGAAIAVVIIILIGQSR